MRTSRDEQYWQKIAAHSDTRNSGGAPWSVQVQLAALVGDRSLTAANSTYSPEAPSSWSILAVTEDARLVRLKVEFEVEQFDYEEEQSPFRQSNPVSATTHAAWARKLSEAIQLDIKEVRRRLNNFREPMFDEVDVKGVSLTFSDGQVVDLEVDQFRAYAADDRARSDAFLDAVRFHTQL